MGGIKQGTAAGSGSYGSVEAAGENRMADMDYRQAREFISKISEYGSVYGLDGIRNLMERMGNVQERLHVIHVAGTNGKGSVCAMLAEILKTAGYRTGRYASPAVFEPEEIIQVNGVSISKEDYAEGLSRVRSFCEQMLADGLAHPTAFEVETAAAFWYFGQKQCDYVVLETGLGGALDATNVIKHPVCSVITSIGRDHMALLGETLEEIAGAKAGIIKPGCPCVSSAQKPEIIQTLQAAALSAGSILRIADASMILKFSYDHLYSYLNYVPKPEEKGQAIPAGEETCRAVCALAGACQRDNIACVLETVQVLREQGISIPSQAVHMGLAHVHLPGRFEQICSHPDFYIDGAHNEAAAFFLRETVRTCFSGRRMVFILGVFADKEYGKLLELMLPFAKQVFTVTPNHVRALDGRILAELAGRIHPAVSCVPKIEQAAAQAAEAAGTDGVVLAFGSFSYLAELRQAVKNRIW